MTNCLMFFYHKIIIINLAVVIMIQLDYGLTRVMLFNCTNCDTLHALLNNSQTNSLLTQDDTLSKSISVSIYRIFLGSSFVM
jgi:hypothetical protein